VLADEGAAVEPIAILGMSRRFPGGLSSPENLRRLVYKQRDAISEVPTDRGWDPGALFGTDAESTAATQAGGGGFIHDVGDFDPMVFGIGPREALAMQPQQRLMLETACTDAYRNVPTPAAVSVTDLGAPRQGGRYRHCRRYRPGHR